MKPNKLLCILLLAALLCAFLLPAAAADVPDLLRTGSIRLTVRYEGREVGGGELTLYQVATLCGDDGYYYAPAAGLEACDFSFDTIENPDQPSVVLAQVKEAGVTGQAAQIGSNGVVFFGDLPLGLYLIEQTESAPGFTAMQPFFITIPMREGDEMIYDVDASPKLLQPQPSEPTELTEPTEPSNPTEPTESTKPGDTLPQTGQLKWPIPVLGILGMVFLLAGLFVLLRGRKRQS